MFVDGGLTGKGYEIYQDENGNNSYYEGDFVNCIKEGKGNESTDIFVYDGDFSNDIKHGNGILTYKKCSDRYEGKFINGVINGHGHYIWDNKHEYEGEFVNAKMHGSGVYKWPDGSIYKGEYVNNIKEGKGEFIWPDKRVYVGTFHEGKPHGKGILKIKGVTIENAEFNKGQLILRNDKSLDLNCLESELEVEVFHFGELWTFVYDNVNNDLMKTFQIDCTKSK